MLVFVSEAWNSGCASISRADTFGDGISKGRKTKLVKVASVTQHHLTCFLYKLVYELYHAKTFKPHQLIAFSTCCKVLSRLTGDSLPQQGRVGILITKHGSPLAQGHNLYWPGWVSFLQSSPWHMWFMYYATGRGSRYDKGCQQALSRVQPNAVKCNMTSREECGVGGRGRKCL